MVRLLGDEIVHVTVGSTPEKQEIFTVHRKLLCYQSEYFRALLQGPFKESEGGVAKLIDEDPKVFQLVVDWVYREQRLRLETPFDCRQWKQSCLLYVGLLALADKLMIPDLPPQVYSRIRLLNPPGVFPGDRVIRAIVKLIPRLDLPTGKLRLYFVEMLAHYIRKGANSKQCSRYLDIDDGFAADVAKALTTRLSKDDRVNLHPFEDGKLVL